MHLNTTTQYTTLLYTTSDTVNKQHWRFKQEQSRQQMCKPLVLNMYNILAN